MRATTDADGHAGLEQRGRRVSALVAGLSLVATSLVATARPMPRQAAPTTLEVDISARAFQPGEVVAISVRTPTPVDDLRVQAWGTPLRPWRVDALTWRALGGLDLDVKPGKYVLAIEAGADKVARDVVVASKAFRTRTLKVDEAFVNPPASVLPRIQREAARLAAFWTRTETTRHWDGAFAAPVPQPANSMFGTRSIYNGQPRSAHGGADFASPAGTPVKAPAAGRVVLAGDLYYTGNTVVIDHGLGLYSLMAHLSAILAREGTDVARGDELGRVGATGRVTGPHLHWTVRLAGARVDPIALIAITERTASGRLPPSIPRSR